MRSKAAIKFLSLSLLFGVLVLLVMSTFKSFLPPSPYTTLFTDASESAERPLEKRDIKRELSPCRWEENSLVGRLFVDQNPKDLEKLKKDEFMRDVRRGGTWKPSDCIAFKVAIIIPYRNREEHLSAFLRQIHPILQRQRLNYQIFVINQNDSNPFNRGKLFNVGFKEALNYNNFGCFVFHDVDLIPEDDRNDYGCPASPRHMCPAVNKFNYQLFSATLFGGVTSFTERHFTLANGYPNRYWGWGAEDDDCYERISQAGLKLSRPTMEVGRYKMIAHKDQPRNGLAEVQLAKAVEHKKSDGLSSLRYKVKEKKMFDLYTQINVDLLMTQAEKNSTTVEN